MASVSAPGTGSGIDVNSLVSQLIAAESQPTSARLDAREKEFNDQFSALGKIRSALSSFSSNLQSLTKTTTFESRAVSVSDETYFTATGSASAVPGSFSIEVERLAEAQKLASAGFAGSTATVGSGTLVLSAAGNAFSVAIPAGADTLGEIRDAINAAPGNPGIRATLVTVDAVGGGTETRLSLSAAATGTLNAVTVTALDEDGNDTDAAGLSRLVYDPDGSGVTNLTETTAPADALIRIDSQPLTSQTNNIDFAIDGVSIQLLKAEPGTETTLSIGVDSQPAASAVSAFVQSYNTLRKTINQLTAFDPSTSQAGVLLGDAGVRGITGGLQRELGATVSGIDSTFSSLAELGIATQSDGTLKLDSSTLQAALDSDLGGVGRLFSSSDGIATRLDALVQDFTRAQGTLDLRDDALQARLRDIASQRETLARRMSDRETALRKEFAAMDTLVAQLRSTSTYLTQQLASIGTLVGGASSSRSTG